jgi:hypothetical protein
MENIPKKQEIPDNFRSIVTDFISDVKTTFPEVREVFMNDGIVTEEENKQLFDYCLRVYPERFFDIINQNEGIFKIESSVNTHFLPNVDFKVLYNCENISENTKKIIWKYLQLILFTIVGQVHDKTGFGDSMNILEGIDEDELQEERVHAGARLCHEHAGKPFADLLSPGDAIMCQLLA